MEQRLVSGNAWGAITENRNIEEVGFEKLVYVVKSCPVKQ